MITQADNFSLNFILSFTLTTHKELKNQVKLIPEKIPSKGLAESAIVGKTKFIPQAFELSEKAPLLDHE